MKPAFPEISKIPYEGPTSKNPLAFKEYDSTRVIENRTMAEHLRFSVAYWHTFRNTLSDPFGVGTASRPWDDGSPSIENACNRARVAFEIIEKLGAPFYAFHDRDVAPEGASLVESSRNLDAVVKVLKEEQERTGIKLLWATACLFTHPRFAHGAATSPNAEVPPSSQGTFSARWTGQIVPTISGDYVFKARGDGGFRVIVNGQKIIDLFNSPPFRLRVTSLVRPCHLQEKFR
jgi:xylose isomerase